MKNYKLDIKEMTETYNNFNRLACEEYRISGTITQEQMSEMVLKHAKKLGYGETCIALGDCRHCYLDESGSIGGYFDLNYFNDHKNKKIGLEFFSIIPQKFVDVRMPEEDAMAFFEHREVCTSITTPKENIKKWELLK